VKGGGVRVAAVSEELAEVVGRHTGQIEGLVRWQTKQNGSLQRIEAQLRRLELFLVIAVALGALQLPSVEQAVAVMVHALGGG